MARASGTDGTAARRRSSVRCGAMSSLPPSLATAPADRSTSFTRRTAEGREFLALITALMASGALAIDFSLPAFPDIRREFGMARDATTVGWLITAFFLGMSVGPWIYGPLSDRYGRRRPLFAGLIIYLVSALLAAVAPSWGWVVAARFLWGLGSAAPRTLCMAMIRDRYAGDAMARAMSMIMAVFLLVPIIAPTVAAGAISVTAWRVVFLLPAGVVLLLMFWARRLPETLDPSLRRPFTWAAVGRGARDVMTHRQTLGFTVGITFLLGVLYVYIAGSEVIVEDVYELGTWFPLFFGAIGVLFAVSSLNNARLVQRIGLTSLLRRMATTAAGLAIVFAVVATVTGGRPPFLVFSVMVGLVVAAVQGMITNSNTAAMTPLAHVAGTASAVISTVSTAGGSLLASVANDAFDGTARPFALLVSGYVLIAAAAVWWGARTSRTAS